MRKIYNYRTSLYNLLGVCLSFIFLGFLLSCGTENKPTYNFVATATPSEGGTIEPSFGQYSEGESLEVRAIPTEGWEFVRWEGDLTQSDNPTQIRIDKDYNVIGVFQFQIILEVVEVYNPTTGRVWMDRNLGASRVATSSTDTEAYGDLYQWGRGADGHEKRNSLTTSTLSSTNQPSHGDFILAPSSPNDWRSPQNTNLWQGVNGVNNPCPSGYRLPTETELEEERLSWSSSDAAGAFASPLKLPVAGARRGSVGSLVFVGTGGYYWSSTVSSTNSRDLRFVSGGSIVDADWRAGGRSVRCIKD